MTIEQRKINPINCITNLDEESVVSQIEGFQEKTLAELPKEIITLLEISASAKESECTEHTDSKSLLDRE